MTAVRPWIVFGCFVLGLAAVWLSPGLLPPDNMFALLARASLFSIGGPLAAALFSFYAARRSQGGDRAAWTNFGIGSSLYVVGNLCYLYFALTNSLPAFPSIPEAAFFVMGLFFAAGFFQYGKLRNRVSRLQIYNFVLIYCAVALTSLFIFDRSLTSSVMPPFATGVALLYPALWWSVAASGLLSLVLYPQGKKTFPISLLLLAMAAEATSDSIYVLQLTEGTFVGGGIVELLWTASAALIAWAAYEHVRLTRDAATELAEPLAAAPNNLGIAQAAIPAVALAIVMLSGVLAGDLGRGGAYSALAAGLAFIFAVISGYREHWVIYTQRKLRGAVESTRTDLALSQKRINAVIESTSDSVIVVDREWRVEYFNKHAAQSMNGAVTLMIGANLWDLFPTEIGTETSDKYRVAMRTQQPVEMEERFGDIWFEINAYPTPDGLSIFFRDISERRRAREAIIHLAHHDQLTSLPNRTLFRAQLWAVVETHERFAIILLDVDHFKEVNDTHGHAIGDALLVATAERLVAAVGKTDIVARLGGDEFVIIAPGADAVQAEWLARRMLAAASTPHLIEGQSIRLGASVGIALAGIKAIDPDRIFQNADIALNVAKVEMRGAFRVFEPAMEEGLRQRQALRTDLKVALENGEFELAFQPLVDLRSERVCGFEALLRWRHPTRGYVSPDEFIPLAEDSGLIVAIGNWVLNAACAEAASWPGKLTIAVNLSAREFANGDLAELVAAALKQSGLGAEQLELEITERVLMRDSKANLEMLHRLRALGLHIALDDFGTGYSSLAYLQLFPFSKIKIDRSFISELPHSESSQAIVRSVIGLGMALGMRVTAEGVETKAQYDWVKLGCNEAQGYFLSRPIAAGEVAALIARIDARKTAANTSEARRTG